MNRTDHPRWYLDETLMHAFIESGGNSLEHQAEKRRKLERYRTNHPLREGEEVGYVHVEAPLGAERMRWMFRTPELGYLPIMLPEAGKVSLVDDAGQVGAECALENMSREAFLRAALSFLLVLKPERRP